MGGSDSDRDGWRSNADTHKMRPEDVKAQGVEASKRPPGQHPGGVLHQRRNMPFNPAAMAVGGFLIVAAIGYFTLYAKSKPGTTPSDVAKATVGDGSDGSGGRGASKSK
ncbi:uncharacterized protein LOC103723810 [Phoenix dactylifera]|uniref:Uncharacterized protein LOC103723810 n=1 Tax=Phoenix dactylifera TaxID=42345 RepID=A0A8B7D4R9_PHODC|nr:uncharacterized protein LOC103723810 [Phoenix dactylifera]